MMLWLRLFRVFIKYYVFSKILKYIPDLWPLSVSPRCQCVYTMASQTPALQPNLKSSEKSPYQFSPLLDSRCRRFFITELFPNLITPLILGSSIPHPPITPYACGTSSTGLRGLLLEVKLPYDPVCPLVGLSKFLKRARSFTSMLLSEHFFL